MAFPNIEKRLKAFSKTVIVLIFNKSINLEHDLKEYFKNQYYVEWAKHEINLDSAIL